MTCGSHMTEQEFAESHAASGVNPMDFSERSFQDKRDNITVLETQAIHSVIESNISQNSGKHQAKTTEKNHEFRGDQ